MLDQMVLVRSKRSRGLRPAGRVNMELQSEDDEENDDDQQDQQQHTNRTPLAAICRETNQSQNSKTGSVSPWFHQNGVRTLGLLGQSGGSAF